MDQWSPTRAGLLGHCEPEDEASPRSKIPLLRDSRVQKAIVALMSAKWSKARCEGWGLHRRAPCHPERHCRQLSSQAHTVVPSPPASYFHPTVASKWVDKSHNFSPHLVPSIGKSKNTTLGDPPGQKCFTHVAGQSVYIGSATWGLKCSLFLYQLVKKPQPWAHDPETKILRSGKKRSSRIPLQCQDCRPLGLVSPIPERSIWPTRRYNLCMGQWNWSLDPRCPFPLHHF